MNCYYKRSGRPSLKCKSFRLIILLLVGCFGYWIGSAIGGLGLDRDNRHYLQEMSPGVRERIVVAFQVLATNDNGGAVTTNVATATMRPHFKITKNGSCVLKAGRSQAMPRW